MKKAGGEARGCPRTAKFGPEIGGSLPAKKAVMGINKGGKELDPAKDCGPVPKGH